MEASTSVEKTAAGFFSPPREEHQALGEQSRESMSPPARRKVAENGPTPRSTNKLLADLEQNFELVSTIERLTLENANLRDTIRSLQSKVQRAESAAEMLRSEKRAIAEESSSLQDRLTRLEHDFHHVLHHVGHHNIPPATRSERSAAGGPANPTSPTPAMPDISLRDVTRVLAAVVGDDTAKLHAPAVARALSAAGATATETVGASAGENLTGAGHATPSDDDDAGDSIRSPVRQYARQLESTANLREIAEAGSLAQSIAQTLSDQSVLRHYNLLPPSDTAPSHHFALPEPPQAPSLPPPSAAEDALLARARALVDGLSLPSGTGSHPPAAEHAPAPQYGAPLGVASQPPATVLGRSRAEEEAVKRRLEFSSWRAGAQVGAEAPSRGGDVRVEGGGDAGDVARGYGEETLRALREAGLRAEEVATSFSVAHSHPASPAKHHESGLGASFASHVAAASLPLPSLSRNPYVYPGHSALGMGATVGSSSKLYSPSGGRI